MGISVAVSLSVKNGRGKQGVNASDGEDEVNVSDWEERAINFLNAHAHVPSRLEELLKWGRQHGRDLGPPPILSSGRAVRKQRSGTYGEPSILVINSPFSIN